MDDNSDILVMDGNVPQVPNQVAINPLLARVHMPGSSFALPSGGIFYTNGELREDVENGEVHVQPMTAYDEILLKTPDLLFSGEAVRRVFTRCIPQVAKPMELFSKDVDFLMICLRKVTYGEEVHMKHTHDCENAKTHEYAIDINHFIRNSRTIDPTTVGKVYKVKLDNGQVVNMHPPRFKDVVKMFQNFDPNANFTPEEEIQSAMDTIMSVISSVDETNDRNMIREWLETIPAKWVNDLSVAIEAVSEWGPDFLYETKCKDCNEGIVLSTPINPLAFFI